MKEKFKSILFTVVFTVSPVLSYGHVYDIRDFGAIPDTVTINTKAIQTAIDQCSQDGGGIVVIQGGSYLTGTLFMKSGVTLRIEGTAKLCGSKNIADYAVDVMKNMYRDEPYMDRCLIFARGQKQIGIEGNGTIDGNGASFPNEGDRVRYRPMLIRFAECENIRVRDVLLTNPGGWTSAWLYCKDIVVDGITVIARVRGNGDGLDFDGCENVRVSNCSFDTSDDSICLQTSRKDRPCKNISITNCIFSSRWAGMRIGLLSRGNFENVIVTACIFQNINDSGLKIQMNEGAVMKNMLFSNLLMVNVPRPIFMTHCSLRAFVDGEEEYPAMQTIGDMTFRNIQVDNTGLDKNAAIIMTGVPGNCIKNITLSDIVIQTAGGGTKADAEALPNEFTVEYFKAQDRRRWPEYSGFGGKVPAYGMYLRHMENVSLNNIKITAVNRDARPELMTVNVKGLSIDGKSINESNYKLEKGLFDPTWESLIANNRFPEWFRDAKFGIWAHWGIQCVPEAGDWYARNMFIQGEEAYRHHLANYGHPSEFGFMEFIPMWKADKWNPEALMKLYKKAGAKYFVAMANHHDNFDNYDSQYQEWNSVNLGPKKDLVAGWEKAARAEGLKFGVSNHSAHAWHWFQPSYSYDPEGEKAGIRYHAYNLTKEDGKGKWWEGYDPQKFYTLPVMVPPDGITTIDSMNNWHRRNDRRWTERIPENNPEFAATWFLRTQELVDKYQPDLLYFDDTKLPLEHYGLDIVAHYYNSSVKKNGSNEVVVTTKGLVNDEIKGVALDCERGTIAGISPEPWQTCSCIGGWHYSQSTYDRNRYKTVETIVKTLVDIVSKNGNLLLSIPVKGDGSIDDKEEAFLEGMAAWMDIHGEGIYGTRPWKIFGEGVANTSDEGSFGERERAQASLSAKDVRFTAKGDKLYAFILGFPKEKTVEIKALGFDSPQLEGKKITGISMMGTDKNIKWEQRADKLTITMPDVKDTGKTIGFVIKGVN